MFWYILIDWDILLTSMGVRAPLSGQWRHSAQTWAEIFRRTCPHSHLQTSPPTHKKAYAKIQNPKSITPPCSPQKRILQGVGGSPNFFVVGILLFLLLRSLCQISKPYDNPFWEKSNSVNRKKKKKNDADNRGHYVLTCYPSDHQPIGPISGNIRS